MAGKRAVKKAVKRTVKKAVEKNPGLLGRAARALGGRGRQIEKALGPQAKAKKKRAIKKRRA